MGSLMTRLLDFVENMLKRLPSFTAEFEPFSAAANAAREAARELAHNPAPIEPRKSWVDALIQHNYLKPEAAKIGGLRDIVAHALTAKGR